MAKELSLLIAAAATALAFAVPSSASAASATCGSSPTLCPVGTVVTKTGTNIELNTEFFGILKCAGITLKGKITQNSGGVIKASGTSETPAQSGCTVSTGGNIEVTTVLLEKQLEASESDGPAGAIKKGVFSFIAKIKLPTGAVCTFTGMNIPGHYVSTANPAVLTSTDPAKDVTSTGGCGRAQLIGSFKLESGSPATNVILH